MKNILNTLLKQLTFGMYDFPRQEGKSASRQNILGTHWRKIPNVREFSVKVSTWNIIFHFFGMSKRNKPDITWSPHENSKFNNYMTRQVKRLIKLKDNPQTFFKIMFKLIDKSYVFRVSAWNKCMPNWYKKLPLKTVLMVNRKIDKIIKTRSTKMDFARVYIKKGENGYRPLGVPTLEWRIYQQLLNNFLYIYVKDQFLDSQHGFLPGKGSLTAWQDLLGKIEKYPYIYEFDLKQCFPTINILKISQILSRL